PAYASLEAEVPTFPGPSLALERVRGDIGLVAREQMPVLVVGESGVGKEVAAQEIHRRSAREGPLLAMNSAARSAEPAASELFGHVAGAFTGAVRRAEGLILAAHGGTLFLDEIGELRLDLQPKLLRALSTGEVRPVGSAETLRAKTRFIAATNRELSVE